VTAATALRTNADKLVTLGIGAQVSHPTGDAWSVDSYGRPIILPGMAGVCYNVRVGSAVFPWAADHLEAAVSAGGDGPPPDAALQFLACVGNPVRVLTGPAAGGTGTVVGKHAFVLIDFPQETLDLLGPGDRLLVRARGQGLQPHALDGGEIRPAYARRLGHIVLRQALEFAYCAKRRPNIRPGIDRGRR